MNHISGEFLIRDALLSNKKDHQNDSLRRIHLSTACPVIVGIVSDRICGIVDETNIIPPDSPRYCHSTPRSLSKDWLMRRKKLLEDLRG